MSKKRVLSSELNKLIGEKVVIKGWLHNIRLLGKLAFLLVRDREGEVQVVVAEAKTLEQIKDLQVGSVLTVEAEVVESAKTEQGVELVEPEIEIINAVSAAWPVEINKPELKANLDTILENRALTLRHPQQAAVFKIQGTMAQAYRNYMVRNGFTEFFGPALIASSSEGGAEIFRVKYFVGEATLAQSNQLYKQMMVGVYERVFGMAKWFRAENSNTRRHLTEGSQYEFELGFIDDITEVMQHLEAVLREMLADVSEKNAKELKLLGKELARLPTGSFPVLKFSEAIKIVAERTGEDTSDWQDLTTESERELCAYARAEFASDFIFVTNYPKGKFYAYVDEQGVYHNFDLLCREAEIVSGGRRVDNYDKLVAAIKKEGMDPEAFSEYLSIFKYGMPPHGGFGLGFERFTMLALGLENIREASLFPSDTKRIASQPLQQNAVRGADAIKIAIKQLFVTAGIEFQVLKHEPTPTSEDSARVRQLPLEAGIKALILRDKKGTGNVQVNIPAHQKLDLKKFTDYYNAKFNTSAKFEFEKPDRIFELYGLAVGGVPPFGQVYGVATFNDSQIFANQTIAFNNADQSESLLAKGSDLALVLSGEVGEFTAS